MRRLRFMIMQTLAIMTATPAPIGSASAQSFGSSYASTAKKHCGSAPTSAAYGRFATMQRIDSAASVEPPWAKHACSGPGGTYG
jgi:hypothetical protein